MKLDSLVVYFSLPSTVDTREVTLLSLMNLTYEGNNYFLILIANKFSGLVVRVLGYRSGGPGSIPGTTRKKN
jgi:hypothetical protein